MIRRELDSLAQVGKSFVQLTATEGVHAEFIRASGEMVPDEILIASLQKVLCELLMQARTGAQFDGSPPDLAGFIRLPH